MKTRNTDTPKSGPTKKTPVKKTTEKTPPKPSEPSNDSATPKSAPSTAPKQAKNVASAKTSTPKTASKPESKVEGSKEASTPKTASKTESKVEGSSASVTPEVKVVQKAKPVAKRTPGKTTKSPSVKSASAKTPKSVKSASAKTPKSGESVKLEVEQSSKEEEEEEPDVSNDVGSLKKEEPIVVNVDESPKKEEPIIANMVESSEKEVPTVPEVVESSENEKCKPEPASVEEEEEEYVEADEDTNEPKPEAEGDLVKMEEDTKKDKEVEGDRPDDEELNANDGMEDYNEQEGFEEPGDEEIAEDDASDPDEEAAGLEAENMEISALAKERRIKKEQEIFVGGLDRDAVEDDIKKAFEKIGEVVEVRLHRNPLTNKNKGYAFVKFVDKEHATRALSELKNPIIRGKRCGVASSEDNDTLFVGNICNTWTKEAIKQKLKEYGLEGVENITLVADARHEGLSRGFAFVEFSCHADAMLAYKRLQKPDVIFGHAERTVKVAFAEPLREPDPEIMAHVKSVFVDGLPPHWDEEQVREHFKGYGEIERIVLARNMPTAKRKDFGFVDFTTHEAAIACINGVNNTELGDEKSKTKVKVRLASPLPKTQAVKGGLCGGFRIGHANSGFARFGRGFARGGRPFNRGNFQRGKDFHARGRGRAGRFAFGGDNDLEGPYSGFRGRQPFGGRGGRMEYGKDFSSRPATSSRSDLGRSRHGAFERGRGKAIQSRREPFQSEGHYGRPFGGRHFVDDPYLYDDSGYGVKRPFSAMDYEPGYLEPSRQRPRFDHLDPIVSSRRSHYQDSFGAGSGLYSHDYYGSDYGGSAYSSMYGGDSSYGSGYYY